MIFFRSIRINAGVILPDLKARKLLPPVVLSPYDDDDDDDDRMCVCVCVCVCVCLCEDDVK